MDIQHYTLLSASGNEIVLRINHPKEHAKGIIQINTGTCIPQKIYWKFADYLTRNGYITITYECSDAHHYRSEVSHEVWLKDMASVFDYVITQYSTLKKYMVGHSSGGQLVGYIPNCDKIDKLYLVACSNGYLGNLDFVTRIGMQLFWKLIVPYSIRKYGYMNNKLLGSNGGFPKNIILELGSWCKDPDFFIPYFKQKHISSYYHTIQHPVKAFHLADDVIANRKSCEYILNLYTNADKSIETLKPKEFGMKKFGHRGFFQGDAEKKLWPYFLKELES